MTELCYKMFLFTGNVCLLWFCTCCTRLKALHATFQRPILCMFVLARISRWYGREDCLMYYLIEHFALFIASIMFFQIVRMSVKDLCWKSISIYLWLRPVGKARDTGWRNCQLINIKIPIWVTVLISQCTFYEAPC